MTLSLETTKALARGFQTQYDLRMNVDAIASFWREQLERAGVTDENGKKWFHAFYQHWDKPLKNPRFNDLVDWIRGRIQERRAEEARLQEQKLREQRVKANPQRVGAALLRMRERLAGGQAVEEQGRRETLQRQAADLTDEDVPNEHALWKGVPDVADDEIPF